MIGTGAESSTGISKYSVKDWQDEYNVNVLGVVFFAIALLPLLEKGKDKKVVNITSFLGEVSFTLNAPQLHFTSYSATKAAVTLATQSSTSNLETKGFIFISLNPGWFATDLGSPEMRNQVCYSMLVDGIPLTNF